MPTTPSPDSRPPHPIPSERIAAQLAQLGAAGAALGRWWDRHPDLDITPRSLVSPLYVFPRTADEFRAAVAELADGAQPHELQADPEGSAHAAVVRTLGAGVTVRVCLLAEHVPVGVQSGVLARSALSDALATVPLSLTPDTGAEADRVAGERDRYGTQVTIGYELLLARGAKAVEAEVLDPTSPWPDVSSDGWSLQAACEHLARTVLYAGAAIELVAALWDLVAHQDDPCSYDHHGYCQAHVGGSSELGCANARGRLVLGLRTERVPVPTELGDGL